MNYEEQKNLALQIVSKSFANKTDLAGEPYIKHLSYVAEKSAASGDVYYIVGLLHDLLEDCPEWTADALAHLFHHEIVAAVVVLTKAHSESYESYIDRVKQNDIARTVKRHDLIHNMDLTRLIHPLSDKGLCRVKKYHTAYLSL